MKPEPKSLYDLMGIHVVYWISPDNPNRAELIAKGRRYMGAVAYRTGDPFAPMETDEWQEGYRAAEQDEGKRAYKAGKPYDPKKGAGKIKEVNANNGRKATEIQPRPPEFYSCMGDLPEPNGVAPAGNGWIYFKSGRH